MHYVGYLENNMRKKMIFLILILLFINNTFIIYRKVEKMCEKLKIFRIIIF